VNLHDGLVITCHGVVVHLRIEVGKAALGNVAILLSSHLSPIPILKLPEITSRFPASDASGILYPAGIFSRTVKSPELAAGSPSTTGMNQQYI
jgi:hypothetical protein